MKSRRPLWRPRLLSTSDSTPSTTSYALHEGAGGWLVWKRRLETPPVEMTHHVTSHWPNAHCVTTTSADDPESAAALMRQRDPDAVILQMDFGSEAWANAGLDYLARLLRASPGLHGIVLAENGDEVSAVRAMKCGAKDYLPLARISRESLLKAVSEAAEKRREAALAAEAMLVPAGDTPPIQVPGYGIVKEIATSNFSSVYPRAKPPPAAQCRAQGP